MAQQYLTISQVKELTGWSPNTVKKYVELGLSDGINIEIVEGINKDDNIKVFN